jgi:hypothetical protein
VNLTTQGKSWIPFYSFRVQRKRIKNQIMNSIKINEDVLSLLLLLMIGLFAARPALQWLLIKLYNLFIGKNHI